MPQPPHIKMLLHPRWARLLTLALAFFAANPLAHGEDAKVRHEKIEVEAPFKMPAIEVPVFPARDFCITDYGAKDGDEADNTEAIRKAIAACHESGGGRVVVPKGKWFTGPVHLKSNVNLHLEEGGELCFSDKPQDYLPAVPSSWEGWECYNYSPLVYAFECENIAISGKGTLRPHMGTWKKWFARPNAHMDALKRLYEMGSKGVPVEQRQMAEGENNMRPQLIQFNRCRNILIEDIKIRQSPFWTIHLFMCDSAVVRRVDSYAHGHNNDGIDPEMTSNLLIEDCRFDQGDDAIAIKAARNQDGWRLNKPTENVVIRNCTVINGHQLVAIGSELSAGIRNVYVHDCKWQDKGTTTTPFNVLLIKTNHRRGGFVENITVENIDASNAKFRNGVLGIETDVLYQWRNLVHTYEVRITPISRITVKNVQVGSTATPFRILGDKRKPVRDILIDNISIDTVTGQKNRYENAENIKESNIHIRNFQEKKDKDTAAR